jgi:DNA-binding CsgD family transcriptional regulator
MSGSEARVLRYLPTSLSGPEIASELYVSHNTVRTHLRRLYAKLGTHRRAGTVARALAPGPGCASWLRTTRVPSSRLCRPRPGRSPHAWDRTRTAA